MPTKKHNGILTRKSWRARLRKGQRDLRNSPKKEEGTGKRKDLDQAEVEAEAGLEEAEEEGLDEARITCESITQILVG
jgi:hypothetical protein